jgi:cyclopropane fatty-acyl-phospholipid synthase-like methyltransferase
VPESIPGRTHDEIVDIVSRGYDLIADEYLAAVTGSHAGDPRDEWTAALTARLAPGAAILDVGCGPGVPTAAALSASGYTVTGIDVSARQIELARAHVPDARFEVADACTYRGAAAHSVDAIVALYSLTHIPRDEYEGLFVRFAQWLRPGGWFLAALGRSESAGFDEVDFLGFAGAHSFTNSFEPVPTLALLERAGFVVEEQALVDDDTPFGREQWLWVLARTPL